MISFWLNPKRQVGHIHPSKDVYEMLNMSILSLGKWETMVKVENRVLNYFKAEKANKHENRTHSG